MTASDEQRTHGCYYTEHDAFSSPAFATWAARALSTLGPHDPILEPFLGAGHIPAQLHARGWNQPWVGVDRQVVTPLPGPLILCHQADSFKVRFTGFQVAITNPPYLARYSASRRGLPFGETVYDNRYKQALAHLLDQVAYVAAIVPESFVACGLFRSRLTAVISLTQALFADTRYPVCLALFEPAGAGDGFAWWHGDRCLGTHAQAEARLPPPARTFPWRFNDPQGDLALIGYDGLVGPSIQFAPGAVVEAAEVKPTSRMVTRIGGVVATSAQRNQLIEQANAQLAQWRAQTQDVLLTPFKGVRRDGQWRRRLDYARARHLLDLAASQIWPGP